MNLREFFAGIILLFLFVNTYLLYQGTELLLQEILTYGSLIFVSLMYLTYVGSNRVLIKKDSLRFSMIVLLALFVISFIARVTEPANAGIELRWLQTVLYAVSFLMMLSVSRGLYDRLVSRYNKLHSYGSHRGTAH